MYSIFFKMSEIIVNITFALLERIFLKKEETLFKEQIGITIAPTTGFAIAQEIDRYFAEYRGKYLKFKPKFPVYTERDIKKLPLTRGKMEPEALYISWKELASDTFFKDVEVMFKKLGGGRDGAG